MWKTPLAAVAIATILVACGSPAPVDQDDPFNTLFPWDETRKDITEVSTGLQYIELNAGSEDQPRAVLGDTVIVNVEGRAAETGLEFESTFKSGFPKVLGVGRVEPGLSQALQIMNEGDEWMLYVPSRLGFADSPPPGLLVEAGADLMYRLELLKVIKPERSDTAAWDDLLPWDPEREGVVTTDSGLQFITLEEGNPEGASPMHSGAVVAFYEGRFPESKEMFDSAFERGAPLSFAVTGVIAGWTEMLQLMTEGQRVMVYIPSNLGYGATRRGPIPANSDLVFEIKLMAALNPPTEASETP